MKTKEKLQFALSIVILLLLFGVGIAAYGSTVQMAGKPCTDRGGIPVIGGPNRDELINCLGIKP